MKIYVSATYRDLAKHRDAVLTVLRRMGHQVIGMEEYVAEGVRPLYRCLSDVASCDAYVGILGWRYGYVPSSAGADDVDLPAGTALEKTSMTEFEFRKAVEEQKPVLIFLLDPRGGVALQPIRRDHGRRRERSGDRKASSGGWRAVPRWEFPLT